jgi:hypothetical protein
MIRIFENSKAEFKLCIDTDRKLYGKFGEKSIVCGLPAVKFILCGGASFAKQLHTGIFRTILFHHTLCIVYFGLFNFRTFFIH